MIRFGGASFGVPIGQVLELLPQELALRVGHAPPPHPL
jgi:hypothetical protein